MAEGQSRYGIMEQLNNRKINEREKLSNLEREKDNFEFELTKKVEVLKQELKNTEQNYKFGHENWKRQKEVELRLLQKELQQKVEEVQQDITFRDSNYEKEYQEWKKAKQYNLKLEEENGSRKLEDLSKKITDKQEVLKEIESGISSLKEMSQQMKEN